MTITKKEYGTSDAKPVILYVKQNEDQDFAYPLLADANGNIFTTNKQGMILPVHDQQTIDESDPNNISITYKLSSVTVATRSIVVSGSTTTISIIYS